MSVEVHVVRVFADERGELGNELGVIRSGAETAGREQGIAARLGFSETVFVDGVADGIARARIFTPASELPFAGHPTVGLAWWLASQGQPVDALDVPAGRVGVERDGDVVRVEARPEWAPAFEWHELASPAEVDALDPSVATEGEHYFWAWTDEAAGAIRSRMFAPALGIREDEATGAAAVALTGRLGRDLDITQGRGSRLRTRFLGETVTVGGRTVADRVLAL